MGRKYRRKKLIVLREAQKRIVLAVSLFPALSLAMATMIIAVFCRRLLGEAAQTEAELPSLVPLFLSVLGFAFVSGLIILHQAVRFSHRVAGPAYRLMKSFEEVKAGNLDCHIRLRKGDHLTDVADKFNEMLAWLNEHPPEGLKPATPEEKGEAEAEVLATSDAAQ